MCHFIEVTAYNFMTGYLFIDVWYKFNFLMNVFICRYMYGILFWVSDFITTVANTM